VNLHTGGGAVLACNGRVRRAYHRYI